jgi:hypothetical protein
VRLASVHRNSLQHTLSRARFHAEPLTMVRRRNNPFASELRSLPYRALLRREEPFRRTDEEEIKATCNRIARGGKWLVYAGNRGIENGCRVFAFDTPEKAQAMQAWIAASGVESRPRPEPPPNYPQLKVG